MLVWVVCAGFNKLTFDSLGKAMTKKISILLASLTSFTLLLASLQATAQETHPVIINNDSIGFSRMDGELTVPYDPVAAFDQHTILVADCSQHKVELKGLNWCFSTAENAEAFTAATTAEGENRYIPFGGGHCALGLVFNNLAARGDPRTAVRIGDHLVLNGNFDVRARFLTDTDTNMTQAARNFQAAISEGKLID